MFMTQMLYSHMAIPKRDKPDIRLRHHLCLRHKCCTRMRHYLKEVSPV